MCGRPLGAGDMYVGGNKTVAIGYPPRGRSGRIQGVPGYLEWQALVLRNGAINPALGRDEQDSSRQTVEQNSWNARGCRKCKKHAEGERKCIKNGARCGMGVWDGNKSRVERLERQGLACQWTIREGI